MYRRTYGMDEKIIFQAGVQAGKEIPLPEEELSIGRDLKNMVVLDDVQVSRHHVRIFQKDGNFFVEDLKSTNGTMLNGKTLTKIQKLKNGDLIALGENNVLKVNIPSQKSVPFVKQNDLKAPGIFKKPAAKTTEEPIEYVEDLPEELSENKARRSAAGKYPTWAIVAMIVIGFIIVFCVVPTVIIETTNQWCNLFSGLFNAISPGVCP
jgi:pSer/pThr/pTyr-binding forkhead associated (FHA) protein